jgi:hypothetical protein
MRLRMAHQFPGARVSAASCRAQKRVVVLTASVRRGLSARSTGTASARKRLRVKAVSAFVDPPGAAGVFLQIRQHPGAAGGEKRAHESAAARRDAGKAAQAVPWQDA